MSKRPGPKNLFKPQPELLATAAVRLGELCRGKEVFEYGSGGSTIWLAGIVKRLVSIEDDIRWFNAVSRELKGKEYSHVEIRFAPPVDLPTAIKGSGLWDVVFVDCRLQESRRRSIIRGATHVKPGGWLVADDYHFPKTRVAISSLRKAGWKVEILYGTKIHPVRKVPVKTSTAFCQKPILRDSVENKLVHLPGGIVVAIHGPLYQQKWWLKGKFYEPEMLSYVRKKYHGGTFIDGGACIGNHTLWFARFCADQVIAVEPLPRNMKHLQLNLELSGLTDKVVTVEVALGEKPGLGEMEPIGKYHGQWKLTEGDAVEVSTLDAVAKLATHPITLLKLDIEGGELLALQGGKELFSNHHPVVIVEACEKEQIQGIKSFLTEYGYKLKFRFERKHNFVFV